MGDGTTIGKSTPVQVLGGLAGVTAISAGGYHSLAWRGDGTAWSWGNNFYGQLGDGTQTNRLTPVQVSGLAGVTAISGGYHHSLSLKGDGTAWSWGRNNYGQLGDGTQTNRLTPVQVFGLVGVVAVSAGTWHSLALKGDGTVWAWGLNFYGQLGDGTTTNRFTPVQVFVLTIPTTANVTFYQVGVDTDFTGTVLTIDGTINLGVDDLPKTFTWDIGSDHTYAYHSPLYASSVKRYVWTSTTSGGSPTTQSGTITALIWGGTYTGNYKTQFIISASAGTGGTISPSGSVPVDYGDDITFTITADITYDILDVVVDGASQGAISSYTFYAVSAGHSISASFGTFNHDIAVIAVTPSKTRIGQGYPLLVDVTVENQGDLTESFNLTVYYGDSAITAEQWETFWSLGDVNRDGYINGTDQNLIVAAYGATPGMPGWNPWADLNQNSVVDIIDAATCGSHDGLEIWTYFITGGVIQTLQVIDLAAGNTQEPTFTWDTSSIPYGNYVICAYAVPILGKEADRADNTLTNGVVMITIPGDADGDRTVNVFDILKVKYHWYPGPPLGPGGYDPNVDVNCDGAINVFDILLVKANWGQSW